MRIKALAVSTTAATAVKTKTEEDAATTVVVEAASVVHASTTATSHGDRYTRHAEDPIPIKLESLCSATRRLGRSGAHA